MESFCELHQTFSGVKGRCYSCEREEQKRQKKEKKEARLQKMEHEIQLLQNLLQDVLKRENEALKADNARIARELETSRQNKEWRGF